LDVASQSGCDSIVLLLIEHGAQVRRAIHADDNPQDGYTPLHFAAEGGHLDVVQTLVAHGANVLARAANGNQPIHLSSTWHGTDTVIAFLVAHGASVNAVNNYHQTPLHLATWEARPLTISKLLKLGANSNIGDSAGDTPLHLAAHAGRTGLVAELITADGNPGEHHANVNLQNREGQTALMLAVQGNYDPTVDTLLRNGAKPNLKDREGRTALFYLQPENFQYIAHLLLVHGADINVKDKDGLNLAQFYLKKNTPQCGQYIADQSRTDQSRR